MSATSPSRAICVRIVINEFFFGFNSAFGRNILIAGVIVNCGTYFSTGRGSSSGFSGFSTGGGGLFLIIS
jgi:hypothetical protein